MKTSTPGHVAIFDPSESCYYLGSLSSDGDVKTYVIQHHAGEHDSASIRDLVKAKSRME
jgi:hypothetical protein